MNYKLILPILLLLFTGCVPESNPENSLLSHLPMKTVAIIKINDLAAFKSELKNNAFLTAWEDTQLWKTIVAKVKALDYFETNAGGLLFFTATESKNIEFLLIMSGPADIVSAGDGGDKRLETSSFQGHQIEKYTIDNHSFYSCAQQNTRFLSSSEPLLQASLTASAKEVDPGLQTLYAAANPDKSASVFINLKLFDIALAHALKEESKLKVMALADWMTFDMHLRHEQLNMNGIAMLSDTARSAVNLFRNIHPIPGQTATLAPINTLALVSYGFDNHANFDKNRLQYLDIALQQESIFNTVEEIGIVYTQDGKAVVLNTFGADEIASYLSGQGNGTNNYQGNEIYSLRDGNFLKDHFKPLIENFYAQFYTIIENAFLFSDKAEVLYGIINNYKSGTTFNKGSVYESARGALAEDANFLFLSSAEGIEHLLADDLKPDILTDLKKSALSEFAFAAQLVADDTFHHLTLAVKKIGSEKKGRGITPHFTVALEAAVAGTPQFVINHRTNQKEIVVQDEENNLYLISTDGKVLWKKQLNGRIQGKISQVDIYKNGRLQLAFTTDNEFLILDRNGKEVRPFNISYQGGNLNPLAVFDYDGNKNYRFVVTQGTSVFMYNSQAKLVKGFTYTKTQSPVVGSPAHFRLNKKDYLVFKLENGSLEILNRIGKTRVKVPQKIDFSNNDVYLYRNKFSVTDKKGIFFTVDPQGKIASTRLNLNADHGLDATSKTLVYMNENVLSIKGKKVTLDFGVYSRPKIFYLYDKIYVSVTDLQSQLTYLFDSNAEAIPGFPVFGSSGVDLSDMDNNRTLEMVTKDQDNSLIVYSLN